MHKNYRSYINEVKNLNPIMDVIMERIFINGSGMAKCPFHVDNNPSLSIASNKEYFNCFGCNAGGDVIRFVELYENCSFIDALNLLADRVKLARYKYTPEMTQELEEDKRRQDIRWAAVSYYHRNLRSNVTARKYLANRGIPEKLIESEKIGVTGGQLSEFLLHEKNFNEEDCVKAGLLRMTQSSQNRDWFNTQYGDRIILPNIRRGRVIHITGRTLGEESERNSKYWHIKGDLELWGVDSTRGKDSVVVTEGIFDALTLMAHGIPSIALVGVNLKGNYSEGV